MTSENNACPICDDADGVCYMAENGRFRIYWAHCGHSTEGHPDLGLARLEWIGSCDAATD